MSYLSKGERVMLKRIAIALMVGISAWGMSPAAHATQPNPEHKVTICHAHPADSLEGPWVLITVDVASVGYQHQGHESEHDGDIIPPYSYTDVEGQTFSYAGKGDQAILANGCVATDPTPTPTPTETPSPTPTETQPPKNSRTPTWTPTWSPTNGATPGQHPLASTGFASGKAVAAAAALGLLGLGSLFLARRRAA